MSYIDPEEIIILGKHLVVTDALKNYVLEKLQHVELFGKKKAKVSVTLEKQKLQHNCEIFFAIDHTHIKVHGSMDEMYAAIDKASDRLKGKLRKYKTRLQEHHNRPLSVVEMNVSILAPPVPELEVINEDIEDKNEEEIFDMYKPHEIKTKEKMLLKTLTRDEAIMKMDLGGDAFLVYRSEEDQKLKVLYRREDDNYGLIEPE